MKLELSCDKAIFDVLVKSHVDIFREIKNLPRQSQVVDHIGYRMSYNLVAYTSYLTEKYMRCLEHGGYLTQPEFLEFGDWRVTGNGYGSYTVEKLGEYRLEILIDQKSGDDPLKWKVGYAVVGTAPDCEFIHEVKCAEWIEAYFEFLGHF